MFEIMAVPENLGLTTVTLPGNSLPPSHEERLVSSFLVSFPFLPQIPGQDQYVFKYSCKIGLEALSRYPVKVDEQ